MNDDSHPNSRAAERRRKAAERAREHRARAAASAALDAAIVDALGEAFAMARAGMGAREFILGLGEAALRHLGQAGVERPKKAFRQRLGLAGAETPSSCSLRSNR